jgi:hypothetical protein
MKKTAVIISILLSGSVLIVCSIMAIGYWRRPDQVKNIGDWITLLTPIAVPLVGLILGFVVLRCKFRNPLTKGCVVGAFYGATLYMFVPTLQILNQFSLIAQDGTAYWGMLMLPALFLGFPLIFSGMIIGLIIGIIRARKSDAQ